MRIEISKEEFEVIRTWYNVTYGECELDDEDIKLMDKLQNKFKKHIKTP